MFSKSCLRQKASIWGKGLKQINTLGSLHYQLSITLFIWFLLLVIGRHVCDILNTCNGVSSSSRYTLNPFPHTDAFWRLCSRQLFENSYIVAKEEIAQNKQFLLLPQCFPLLVIGYPLTKYVQSRLLQNCPMRERVKLKMFLNSAFIKQLFCYSVSIHTSFLFWRKKNKCILIFEKFDTLQCNICPSLI